MHIPIYNNKIRFGNCLGEGKSRAYKVFHPIYIYNNNNIIVYYYFKIYIYMQR